MDSLPWYQEGKTDQIISQYIHYPECWDTCAYPTLASALWEMCHTSSTCPTCDKPQGKELAKEMYEQRNSAIAGDKECTS